MLNFYSILLTAAAANPVPADVAQQFERWERRLRSRVERLHVIPAEAQKIAPCNVVVRFAVDGDGRPAGARVQETNCSRYYERRALALVRELGRVGPVPSGTGKDHQVTLKLSYGVERDGSADRRLTDALAAERRTYARRNLTTVAAVASEWQSAQRQP